MVKGFSFLPSSIFFSFFFLMLMGLGTNQTEEDREKGGGSFWRERYFAIKAGTGEKWEREMRQREKEGGSVYLITRYLN